MMSLEFSRNPMRSNLTSSERKKYPCYACGGHSHLDIVCPVCKDGKFVSDDNPLAKFFHAVLQHKLGYNPSSSQSVNKLLSSGSKQLNNSEFKSIEEQRSHFQEELQCNYCRQELPPENYLTCKECVFNVCASCANKDGLLNHEHKLMLKNEDNQFQFTESAHQNSPQEYSSSETYIKQLIDASQTSSKIQQPTINPPEPDTLKPQQIASAVFGNFLQVPDNISSRSIRKKKNAVKSNDSEESSYKNSQHLYLWHSSQKKSGQIESISNSNSLIHPQAQSNLIQKANKDQNEEDKQNMLRRKSRTQNYTKNGQNLVYRLKVPPPQQQKNHKKDYIFCQYICNNCSINPINRRYHCRQCQDYDLCAVCFEKRNKIHPFHGQFIIICGEDQHKIKQQQIDNQKEKILNTFHKFGNITSYKSLRKVQNVLQSILNKLDKRK